MKSNSLFHAIALAGLLVGCGEDKKSCTVGEACSGGQFCESYVDASGAMQSACFAPTLLAGKVTNTSSGAAVAGARVVAIDGDSHAAVGPVSITNATGDYSVRVTAPRMSGATKEFTLRVGAAGFDEFPSGIRIALPISVSFTDTRAAATIAGPVDVGLTPMAAAPAGSIAGKVRGGITTAGVLVVASDGTHTYSTVSDAMGDYVLFNVADGSFQLRGYFVGASFTPVDGVTVTGARRNVDLVAGGDAAGTLTGSLSYVAGADTSITTAVVLRLQSTHEVPPGLRIPATNSTPYLLDKIPDGTYEVVAAFPNDKLVKDPDPGQAGTTTPLATFAGSTIDVGSFKITDPVEIMGPDANAEISETPTFTWLAYPQTDHYMVEVFDSQGNLLWQLNDIPRSTSLAYGGPALTAGSYYQWRITSFAQSSNTSSRPVSQSEDLRGVWRQMTATP
jgi:hypothetical protein